MFGVIFFGELSAHFFAIILEPSDQGKGMSQCKEGYLLFRIALIAIKHLSYAAAESIGT